MAAAEQRRSYPATWHGFVVHLATKTCVTTSSVLCSYDTLCTYNVAHSTSMSEQAVEEHFVRFCMLHRNDGADMLAGAFAKEAAR